MADAFTLNPGSIVAVDRGYNDYGLFAKWTVEAIYFFCHPPEGECLRRGGAVWGSADQPKAKSAWTVRDELLPF